MASFASREKRNLRTRIILHGERRNPYVLRGIADGARFFADGRVVGDTSHWLMIAAVTIQPAAACLFELTDAGPNLLELTRLRRFF